jgi:hypothetical protein
MRYAMTHKRFYALISLLILGFLAYLLVFTINRSDSEPTTILATSTPICSQDQPCQLQDSSFFEVSSGQTVSLDKFAPVRSITLTPESGSPVAVRFTEKVLFTDNLPAGRYKLYVISADADVYSAQVVIMP